MIEFLSSFTDDRFENLQVTIEAKAGIKKEKQTDDYKSSRIEYSNEKENCKIILSLLKGLDGGGTISLFVVPLK